MPSGIYIRTEETKRKMSESAKIRPPFSLEARKKMSLARVGKKLPEEHRERISNSLKGHVGWFKGKKLSEETKRRMSEVHKNMPRPYITKEWTENISRKLKGRVFPRMVGSKCNFWKGGLSYEPYGVNWTSTLRRSIRERDKHICRICGVPQDDISHDVHHIDYDKKNCNPNNLITLCKKCHLRTSQDRDYYKNYFKEIMVIN